MKFLIITNVTHKIERNQYFAYAPYVREMNIWGNNMDEITIVAPRSDFAKTAIDCAYEHLAVKFIPVESFDVLSLKGILKTILKTPKISWQLYAAMCGANHIHLRCPGNMGLLGSVVQILFPKIPKTAKYAGNWDPKSKQPWTYRLQKWIISNSFLTRNMQVLVYGEWENSTKNIKPFFTATYSEADKEAVLPRNWSQTIHFVFVGTLVKGKNPLYAIQMVERLYHLGHKVQLTSYGEGVLRSVLEHYIKANQLEEIVHFASNQPIETVKQAYQTSHFVLLPSDSEGWPKVIAEGMFWGCVPLATKVSCVSYMLDYGKRGIVLEMNLEKDSQHISALLEDPIQFDTLQKRAVSWSRSYTTDVFELEIKKLLGR
jgi:glycosyltransferase involved in cell wall biosynthesis